MQTSGTSAAASQELAAAGAAVAAAAALDTIVLLISVTPLPILTWHAAADIAINCVILSSAIVTRHVSAEIFIFCQYLLGMFQPNDNDNGA